MWGLGSLYTGEGEGVKGNRESTKGRAKAKGVGGEVGRWL
jgi:hypothetical protein